MAPEYSCQTYWNERYRASPEAFEWYHGWTSLQGLLLNYFPVHARILQVGVGTSELQLAMVEHAGYTSITNTDFSPAVIKRMTARHEAYHHQLRYMVSDCRSMVEFADSQFDCVLDKGTLDAIMCGSNAHEHAKSMVHEIHRVLNDTGVFMEISYGTPDTRLPHLQQPSLQWRVEVFVLQRGAPTSPDNPVRPVSVKGPFDCSDEELMSQLEEHTDVHFVYICTKQQ